MLWLVSVLCVLAIGSCHWLALWVAGQPESQQLRWASFGGGAGLAYVFVHLLPELASGGAELSERSGLIDYAPTPLIEAFLFLVALGGVLMVFSVNVITRQKRNAPPLAVWMQLISFASINYLYAYSLPSLITTGVGFGVLFTVALSAHVLLADRYAAVHHPKRFRRLSRWIGSAALLMGLLHAYVLHPVDEITLATATAFLGGGLLMAVFRDELPEADQTRLPWLLAGSGVMGLLLILQLLGHGH